MEMRAAICRRRRILGDWGARGREEGISGEMQKQLKLGAKTALTGSMQRGACAKFQCVGERERQAPQCPQCPQCPSSFGTLTRAGTQGAHLFHTFFLVLAHIFNGTMSDMIDMVLGTSPTSCDFAQADVSLPSNPCLLDPPSPLVVLVK